MKNTQAFRSLRRAATRLALWQVACGAMVAAAAGWVGGRHAAISALAGGAIGAAAGFYQARRVLAVDASENPGRFMSAVYVSEVLKILLTVALFIAAIRALRAEFLPLMAGYVATFGVYWAALRWPLLGAATEMGGFRPEIPADKARVEHGD